LPVQPLPMLGPSGEGGFFGQDYEDLPVAGTDGGPASLIESVLDDIFGSGVSSGGASSPPESPNAGNR
jgi:hypothetical protein